MMKIYNNLYIKTETVLEIGKFVILWNIFEKNKCNTRCTNQKLINIGQRYKTTPQWQQFAKVMKNRACLLDCTIQQYVETKLSLGDGTKYADAIMHFINSDGKESIYGGLFAIYRIRNNMFHGLKERNDLDNQINLFISINAVLVTL